MKYTEESVNIFWKIEWMQGTFFILLFLNSSLIFWKKNFPKNICTFFSQYQQINNNNTYPGITYGRGFCHFLTDFGCFVCESRIWNIFYWLFLVLFFFFGEIAPKWIEWIWFWLFYLVRKYLRTRAKLLLFSYKYQENKYHISMKNKKKTELCPKDIRK